MCKNSEIREVPGGCRSDLTRLEEWAGRNQFKFTKDKHQVLLLGKKLWYKDMASSCLAGSSSVGRDPGVWAGTSWE